MSPFLNDGYYTSQVLHSYVQLVVLFNYFVSINRIPPSFFFPFNSNAW